MGDILVSQNRELRRYYLGLQKNTIQNEWRDWDSRTPFETKVNWGTTKIVYKEGENQHHVEVRIRQSDSRVLLKDIWNSIKHHPNNKS